MIFGQQDDPSEIFLKAYLSAQQGEKLEQQDRFKTALAKYRFAGSLIEELRKSHADWQPAVVEYRGGRISEAILRLLERITTQSQLNASASPLPEIAPAAPESDPWSEPGPEVVARASDQALSDTQHDGGLKDSTKKLREKVAELQAALDKTRGDLENARKEKNVVDTHLNDTQAKLAEANNHIITLGRERDDALLQLRSANQTEQHFQSLLAEKNDLQQKLATAEEKVRKLSESNLGTSTKMTEMGQQLAQIQQQFTETKNRNYYLAARAAEVVPYLLSDKPPTIDGKRLELQFELRAPATLKIPEQPDGYSIRVILYTDNRQSGLAFIDWNGITKSAEHVTIPGDLSLLTHSKSRSLLASIGNEPAASQFIELENLSPAPRKQDETWSDWIFATEQADRSPIPEVERFAIRYRVRPVEH